MSNYAFELGRNKELCFAELLAFLGEENLVEKNLDTAIFKVPERWEKNLNILQDSLGGTIKIIRLTHTAELPYLPKNIKPLIELILRDHLQGYSGKVNFSLSILSFLNIREINIKELLSFSKIFLKSLNLNSRFVNKDFKNSKPSTIHKAKVLEKGIDLNIIKGNKALYLGYTVALQNIDAYSMRDFDKPGRDARVGMLPPKLAQILINLAGPETKSIYDPFCGTGTVLMEAMLMDKVAIGSDLDERMIKLSETNLTWLKSEYLKAYNEHYKSNISLPEARLFCRDARFITKELLPEKIDAIITEGYLGEPKSRLPHPLDREKTFRELGNLHLNWLLNASKITPKSCKIVMCVTAFQLPSGKIEQMREFPKLAKEAGWRIKKSFVYSRPDQIVARNIAVLEKI